MSVQRVPILVYHHVYSHNDSELRQASFDTGAGIIGETEFRRQMEYLADNNWKVVSTTQIVYWLTENTPLPEQAVALHFDNGWLDTLTVALPIIQAYGFTATCFPITDGIVAATGGQEQTVRTLTEGVVQKPFMDWSQLTELLIAGWEIGAHTARHGKLAEVYETAGEPAVVREAEAANGLFERYLDFIPVHFAYPSGSRSPATDTILSRYYRSLRLWHFDWPIRWTFTSCATSLLAIDCQNIDLRVPFSDFRRLFDEAKN